MERARETGLKLIQAKELAGRGNWIPWLQSINMPRSTAALYMRIAKLSPEQCATVAHLGFRAERELSGRSGRDGSQRVRLDNPSPRRTRRVRVEPARPDLTPSPEQQAEFAAACGPEPHRIDRPSPDFLEHLFAATTSFHYIRDVIELLDYDISQDLIDIMLRFAANAKADCDKIVEVLQAAQARVAI